MVICSCFMHPMYTSTDFGRCLIWDTCADFRFIIRILLVNITNPKKHNWQFFVLYFEVQPFQFCYIGNRALVALNLC
jgi:hypothetical protein